MSILIQIIIYGLSLGMLYFLLSSGFSLIFGLMGVLNFAHGSMFMWGCYLGYILSLSTGSFLFGIIGAAVCIGVMGLVMEKWLIQPLRGNQLRQILLTFGLIYVLEELAKVIFGTRAYMQFPPEWLSGSAHIFSETVPQYRLFMIFAGVIVFLLMTLLLKKTKLGMIIRAGTDKPRMVQAIGINVARIFSITFALGCALAGLGGAIATPFLGAYPTIDMEQVFNAIAVVIIGGVGSFTGAFYASVILGFISYITSYFVPELSMASTLLAMLVVVMIRPNGLFGGKTSEN
ncbi:branched-chain amino acid ABC transporter permease [Clostridia bacterium]|nr:branched-chain amino acid ABC transporter permease [Clostridia bacterium]